MGSTSLGKNEVANIHEDHSGWAMEVDTERNEEDLLREAEEDILELDLGEDDGESSKQYLAMVVYYS